MKKKILVIDDEELLTKTFARLLEKKGYEVLVASRSEDALVMAEEEEDFDLVLCDIRMPGKNGVETVREMQSLLKAKGKHDIPIIFLTGFADKKVEEEAKALNPVAYIFKPFDTSHLLQVIESSLSNP